MVGFYTRHWILHLRRWPLTVRRRWALPFDVVFYALRRWALPFVVVFYALRRWVLAPEGSGCDRLRVV